MSVNAAFKLNMHYSHDCWYTLVTSYFLYLCARSSVDRVLASEARGRWFDSSRAHHLPPSIVGTLPTMPRFAPTNSSEFTELQRLLSVIPAPYSPLDMSALDGFLVGIALQPQRPVITQWFNWILDENGNPGVVKLQQTQRIRELIEKRYQELLHTINGRLWFDPWILTSDTAVSVRLTVQPWILGFAAACELYPDLTNNNSTELNEALAGIYQHLDITDLEDAVDLIEEIESLEYPHNLDDAVEILVSSTMLLADISHPLKSSKSAQA